MTSILPPSQIVREFGRYPGRKLLEILRKEHGITTPVIALTVVTQPEVLEDLWKLGVADVLRKPVRPSVLKQRVEEVLSRFQLSQPPPTTPEPPSICPRSTAVFLRLWSLFTRHSCSPTGQE